VRKEQATRREDLEQRFRAQATNWYRWLVYGTGRLQRSDLRSASSLTYSSNLSFITALLFILFVTSSFPPLMARHIPFLAPRHTTLRTTPDVGIGVGWGDCIVVRHHSDFCLVTMVNPTVCFVLSCSHPFSLSRRI